MLQQVNYLHLHDQPQRKHIYIQNAQLNHREFSFVFSHTDILHLSSTDRIHKSARPTAAQYECVGHMQADVNLQTACVRGHNY